MHQKLDTHKSEVTYSFELVINFTDKTSNMAVKPYYQHLSTVQED